MKDKDLAKLLDRAGKINRSELNKLIDAMRSAGKEYMKVAACGSEEEIRIAWEKYQAALLRVQEYMRF